MDSYNFKCDKQAAVKVFEALSGKVPFRMLGKHAAYKVGIKIQDFQTWNRGDDKPSVENAAKA